MSDGAQFTHAHMVRFERPLPGPPSQAWGFLADPAACPAGMATAASSRGSAVPSR